jgi:glycosyltransferase involved in cell wall biosynthesis
MKVNEDVPATEGGRRILHPSAHGPGPVLSIVTVTLNALQGLRETVESVAAQGWEGIEHIVIDGASTDGSVRYLESLGAKIAYWRSRRDGGIYDAMNAGLSKAAGQYVLFLNSGDVLVGRLLGPDRDPGRLLPVSRRGLSGKTVFYRVRDRRQCMPYCHQGILFRNRGLAPFDTRYRIAADYRFFLDNADKAGMAPPPDPREGYVAFDATGVSSTRILERDRESARIIRQEFGAWHWLLFWCRQLPKMIVRRLARALG